MATVSNDPANVERMIQEARQTFQSPPPAVLIAGFILALNGGMVNSISYLELGEHYFVSHLTGDTTHLGMRAAGFDNKPSEGQKQHDAEEAATVWFALLILVCFMIGSCFSGMIISRSAVSVGRSAYGFVLVICATLLCVAATSDITAGKPIGALCAAMSCGAQNGMMTTYAGAIVRTTHVTGTWTDAGLTLGRMIQRLSRCRRASSVDRAYFQADFGKFKLMMMLGLGFTFGCFLGAKLTTIQGLHQYALFIPAGLLASCGIGHMFYVFFVLNIGFWQLLKTSADGPQRRQVLLVIDDQVHDLSSSMIGGLDDLEAEPASASLAQQ